MQCRVSLMGVALAGLFEYSLPRSGRKPLYAAVLLRMPKLLYANSMTLSRYFVASPGFA